MAVLKIRQADGTFAEVPALVGPPGPAPVKGTDYWTADDRRQMVDDILAALPKAEEATF